MKLRTIFSAAIGCAVLVSAFAACSTSPRTIGQLVDDPPPLLTTNDAGEDGSLVGLTQYCPTDKCPAGYTTCPGSRFRCDVNLETDRQNCGACGVVCPTGDVTKGEVVECVAGRCVTVCNPQYGLDCDGITDNGCETPPSDQQNCGACGNACTDPDKPCVANGTFGYQCGCVVGEIACSQEVLGIVSYRCLRPDDDNRNCGSCGNSCPSNPDGGPLAPNTYYGCLNNTCGHLKCAVNFGNCDGDLENGCETPLNTNDHCGTCDPCGAGQECRLNKDNAYECMCPPGLSYCFRECVDLGSDARNCGACGVACNSFSEFSIGVCTHGICTRECVTGRADCNRNPADECEVNINSDPQNCGGCGIVCDAVAGQACAGGRCTVEACPESDAGPVAR